MIPTWKQTFNFLVIWLSEKRNTHTSLKYFSLNVVHNHIFSFVDTAGWDSLENNYIPIFFSTEQFTTWHQSLLQYQHLSISPGCAKNSLELLPSRNECHRTEGTGSERYNWLSKIWASRAHTSIQNQNFYHMLNWNSHFGLEKQFTRESVRMAM